MSNVDAIRKGLDAKIDAVIKSSKEHGKLLASACIAAFLFVAEHGQPGPLTRLYKNVNQTDQEGIRLFVANVIKVHGVAAEGGENSRPVPFLKYNRETGFELAAYTEKSAQDVAAKAMKKKVIKEGETGLAKIPLGRMGNTGEDAMENVFDTAKRIAGLVKALAKNGEKPLALAINRAVGENYAVPMEAIETIARDNDPAAKLKAAEERVAKLKAEMERKAGANENVPAAGEKQKAQA